jgi:hypothetical protein
MPDEPHLREQARAAIQSGKIPSRNPDRTWGGPGVNATCTICDLPVAKDQLEMQVEFARGEAPYGLDKYHIHIRCFAAWSSNGTAIYTRERRYPT